MKKLAFGMGAAALMFGACAEGPSNTTDDFGYNGTGIEFKVSPLTLDTLGDACYSFAVANASNQLVVGRGPSAGLAWNGDPAVTTDDLISGTALNAICASQFGNTTGGDISYVAPCDADLPLHNVTLWVNKLCRANETGQNCPEIQSYVNPCPTGCTLPVTCVENADTPVTFNFTIMGQADQGFFDIAVNFDDVFCSAKLDTCGTDPDGDGPAVASPIRLLFDGQNRMETMVAAVACTRGSGVVSTASPDTRTWLTHTAAAITCTGTAGAWGVGSTNLDLTGRAEGNWEAGGIRGALYYGTESLTNMNKVYTNLAIGVPTDGACTLTWRVVPSQGPFSALTGANTYTSFGFVNFETTSGIGQGSKGCTTMPLNGTPGTVLVNGGAGSSGVTTLYAAGVASGNSAFGIPASALAQTTDGSTGTIVDP